MSQLFIISFDAFLFVTFFFLLLFSQWQSFVHEMNYNCFRVTNTMEIVVYINGIGYLPNDAESLNLNIFIYRLTNLNED